MQNSSQFLEQEKLKCPRCDSTNTKFCYYNNYNLAQPRHFCKSCKRYWTKGGALRNIPVGGGSRKNGKRGSPADADAARPASALQPLMGDDSSVQGSFGNFMELGGRGEALLPLTMKGADFGQGQFGSFGEMSGRKNESLSLKWDDFGQGHPGNFSGMSGSFSSLLVPGSSSGSQFGGLFDGLEPNGLSLQTSEYFVDSSSGQNVDHQANGFLNIGGGGCWGGGGGDWPDLSI
ncbi:hypothetical protein OROMI_026027 [Orobanche minor]